ncbi:unnamed protein product [Calypogeia fissa]
MSAGVGIEQQWLSATAAGSARFLLSFSSSSSHPSSWACRSREAVNTVKRFQLEMALQQGRWDDGASVINGSRIRVSRKLHLQSQHRRYCAEDCPKQASAHGGLLRSLSFLSRRAATVTAFAAAPLTDGVNTEERVESALKDFLLDGSRATSIAHKVWRSVVRQGDTVIDATCGNGFDTLMLAKLVLQKGAAGYVIGLDLQQSALDNTSALLDRELNSSQKENVSLLQLCHSQLDKIVDENSVRLVAFNLGYQPGGDKNIITRADITVKAVDAAVKVLERQGLISITSYVGHPGGREEHDAVREFVAGLPAQDWVCSHLESVNRPLCPHLMFLLKK